MSVRAVEWKLPYTWGKAIEITEDKVINLRLRDENNLIIWDEWDNEIYVDLQLPNEITPTDAFPVWITTGRVIIDNWWDSTGTLICAKTTSGDNIKVFYADNGKLYVDNWTGLFTQVYLKPEVDALLQQLRTYVDTELAKKQDKLIAWDNIEIASDGKTISAILPPLSRFLSLWDCNTWEPISFPASIPFEYETWDHYLVSTVDNTTNYRPDWTEWDGVASTTVETSVVAEWDMYIYDGIRWLLQHNQPWGWGSVISVNWQTWVVTLDADDISDSTTTNKFVTATDKTTWSGKVAVSTDTGNELSSWAKIWLWTTADFSSIVTPDSNTMYIQYTSSWGWGWTPDASRTILYYEFEQNLDDSSWNSHNISSWSSYTYDSVWGQYVLKDSWSINLNPTPSWLNTIWTWDYTVAFWLYPVIPTNVSNREPMVLSISNNQLSGGYAWPGIFFDYYNNDSTGGKIRWRDYRNDDQWINWEVWWVCANLVNWWHHLVMTRRSWTVYCYIDTVEVCDFSSSTNINNCNSSYLLWWASNRSPQWWGASWAMMDKFIVEKVWWTAQEVSDYYNQTKSIYWIS